MQWGIDYHDKDFEGDLSRATPTLKRLANSLTGRLDPEDLIQETYLRCWTHREKFTPETNISAWACFIMRNLFYSTKRKSWRSVVMPVDLDGRSIAELIPTSANQLDRLELQEVLAAWQYLPREMQSACECILLDGMSYVETAEELGTAVGTVKSRVTRAKDILEKLFQVNRKTGNGVGTTNG